MGEPLVRGRIPTDYQRGQNTDHSQPQLATTIQLFNKKSLIIKILITFLYAGMWGLHVIHVAHDHLLVAGDPQTTKGGEPLV